MHSPDEQIVAAQVRDAVVNELMSKPSDRHYAAAELVKSAIIDAWDCAGG